MAGAQPRTVTSEEAVSGCCFFFFFFFKQFCLEKIGRDCCAQVFHKDVWPERLQCKLHCKNLPRIKEDRVG